MARGRVVTMKQFEKLSRLTVESRDPIKRSVGKIKIPAPRKLPKKL